ncbi:MAG: hypothetical protein J7493_04410 [Porphyrobacter sp.]|nr:hypothetical protein [Porphyrobacter sp.]
MSQALSWRTRLILATLPLSLTACSSLGPQQLGVDRSDYAQHLRETDKEELLLNIVAIRYGEPPLVLDVTSVISQYTREGSVRGELSVSPPPDDSAGVVGGEILLRETPTITYTPLSGDHYSRALLAPLAPATLLGMVEAGWSVGPLFRVGIRSINGVTQHSRAMLFAQAEDPEFEPVLAALERLQRNRAIAMDVARANGGGFVATPARSLAELSDSDRADLEFVRRTLNLSGDGSRLSIIFAASPTEPNQLAITTRSMFEILAEMAQGVEIPPEHADQTAAAQSLPEGSAPLIRIRSGKSRPTDPHVAIRYRGYWFWIDGTDVESKRSFLIAQVLMSLNDTSSDTNAPLVTIPTG